MANPLPPVVASLEARLGVPAGSLADEDLVRAQAALDDAAALVLAEAPERADAWTVDAPKVVVLVVLKAARREYENPRGLDQEALGEHSVGLTDTSGVYLTAREVAQVRRAATGRRRGFVGSVRIGNAYADGAPEPLPL